MALRVAHRMREEQRGTKEREFPCDKYPDVDLGQPNAWSSVTGGHEKARESPECSGQTVVTCPVLWHRRARAARALGKPPFSCLTDGCPSATACEAAAGAGGAG